MTLHSKSQLVNAIIKKPPSLRLRTQAPSPDSYQLPGLCHPYYRSRACSFGIGKRSKELKPNQQPGPGAYNLPSNLVNKKFYMGVKVISLPRLKTQSPGPGAYTLKSTQLSNCRNPLSKHRNAGSPSFLRKNGRGERTRQNKVGEQFPRSLKAGRFFN